MKVCFMVAGLVVCVFMCECVCVCVCVCVLVSLFVVNINVLRSYCNITTRFL